eukprot:2079331-Karenia_brevis.AAC.1
MRRMSLSPNVISFSAAISASDHGTIAHEMHRISLSPNVISFSAAISACEKRGQRGCVTPLFDMFSPNWISFLAAISACEKDGQWLCVAPLLDNTAISMSEKGGHSWCVAPLLHEMHRISLSPNVISFSAAISVCEKRGQWGCVAPLLDEIRMASLFSTSEKGGWGLCVAPWLDEMMRRVKSLPSMIGFSAATSACQKVWQWRCVAPLIHEVHRYMAPLLDEMCSMLQLDRQSRRPALLDDGCSISPNMIVCFNNAISACENGGQWQLVGPLLDAMCKDGEWQLVVPLLDKMRRASCSSNMSSVRAPISASEKGGQWLCVAPLLDDTAIS